MYFKIDSQHIIDIFIAIFYFIAVYQLNSMHAHTQRTSLTVVPDKPFNNG